MSIEHLLELPAVRERCNKVVQAPLSFWQVEESALPQAAEYILKLIQRDYNNDPAKIRPHGRWSHFLAAGRDRIEPLIASWRQAGTDELEVCRRMIDLTLVSVLLDAGAGSWHFSEHDTGLKIGRSEGLAVASLHMFLGGLFSSSAAQKQQVDGTKLKVTKASTVLEALQVSDDNPMPGAQGRVDLLIRLGDVLSDPANAAYFSKDGECRPGYLLDYLIQQANGPELSVQSLWHVLITGLANVWPQEGRTKLFGRVLGDVWPAPGLQKQGAASDEELEPALVAFHKLTQWLCYSLIEVIETLTSYKMAGKELQTGLPEYRNAGLFTDFGIFRPKLEAFAASMNVSEPSNMLELPPLAAGHPGIVEWRALTVVYLDRMHKEVCSLLGQQLSLAQVLEAGTWKAGREIAREKRAGGGPPLNVLSDGTVF